MNIRFLHMRLENFKSLRHADISFENRGIVTVCGVNEYEQNASSNGSGKSSLFSGLFWALYGKTPEGISNPRNRFTSEICKCAVDFKVDATPYTIIRTVNSSGQSVTIRKGDTDISARNRTDSDKIIRESILQMSSDLFLSLIYLSQGFGSRLSALSPSGRKERLEQITGTSASVDAFSAILSDSFAKVSADVTGLQTKITQLQGSIDSFKEVIAGIEKKIEELSNQQNAPAYLEYNGVRYTAEDLPTVSSHLSKAVTEEAANSEKLTEALRSQSEASTRRAMSARAVETHSGNIQKLTAQLDAARVSKNCPTCGQVMPQDRQQRLIENLGEQLQSEQAALKKAQTEFDLASSDYTLHSTHVGECQEASRISKERVRSYTYIQSNIPVSEASASLVSRASLEADIDNYSNRIAEMAEEINSLQLQLDAKTKRQRVCRHCMQLTTKQFRTYLLEASIGFLNERLREYSAQLFSNDEDVVSITPDSSKLDIYVGSALYDSLSGGEKRRVDLAVTLAERDLSASVASTTSNLLIMDEIMESMDEQATQVTLELLDRASESVESLFIISHNKYAISADASLTVVKGADQFSYIKED